MLCAYLRHPKDAEFAELERRAAQWQAPLEAVDDFGALDLGVVSRFHKLCRERKPVIWHGHDYKSNVLGIVARRRHPMKLVTTVHGWGVKTWKSPLYHWIDRVSLKWYDHVVCVSEDLHRRCLGLGIPSERCTHVPNAIDTEEFSRRETPTDAKRKLGLPPERLLIGCVARLSAEKRLDLLIQAVGELARRGHDVGLAIAGEGPERAPLEALIRAEGLSDRVTLLGFCADTIALYQAMDICALASVREGLPNLLLEGMAMSVAVVATRIAGIPKLIDDGVHGLLIEPGSLPPLVAALQLLVTDGVLRDRLAKAGRTRIEAEYSFRKRMDRIKAIYDGVLADDRGSAGDRSRSMPSGR